MRTSDDTMRWVWRGSALAVLLIGWLFIFFHNNMHITPPVVFIGLGYLAGVSTIYALFKTGATAVAPNEEDDGEVTWGSPVGARAELERQKKMLLKAIKEAEFDHLMGKLSKRDVDEMVRNYRLRAIDVIKQLEDSGAQGGTVREQIQREVRARLQVDEAREKIERVLHAELGTRKNKKRAAEAARTAALAAAVTGASGQVAAAMAAAAAANTDREDNDDIDETSDAKPEPKREAKVAKASEATEATDDTVAAKADATDDTVAAKADATDDTVAAKADATDDTVAVKADAATDDTVAVKADAATDDTVAVKADAKPETNGGTPADAKAASTSSAARTSAGNEADADDDMKEATP